MKKYIVLALFLVLGGALAQAPSLSLSYEVSPSSINPGGSAQVIVTVTNTDLMTNAEDVEIRLISRTSGIYVTSGGTDLGDITASSMSSGAFAIKARDSALPGTYVLEATGAYDYANTGGSFKLSIPVTVSYRSSLEIFAPDTQVTPGGVEELLLNLKNAGNGEIKDLIVTLSPSNNFVYPVGTVRSSIESIEVGESTEVAFQIRGSDSATKGIQPITVTVTYTDAGGSTQIDTQPIGVTIVDPGTEIVVENVESGLEAGKTGVVGVTVKNVGETNLENLYFAISTDTILRVSGSNEKLLDSLNVGESASVEFEFDVDSDAEARPVSATLSITYQREGGKLEISETKTLGIGIGGEVELRVVDVDTDLDDLEIEVDIANYGNKDAEAVKIVLLQNGDEVGTGFTDTIKPNKHKVFRFDLPTHTNLVIRMSYKDYETDAGEIVVDEKLVLEKGEITPPAPDMTGGIIFLVIVVVIFVWYMRKRSGDKQKIDVSKYK